METHTTHEPNDREIDRDNVCVKERERERGDRERKREREAGRSKGKDIEGRKMVVSGKQSKEPEREGGR